MVPWYVQYSKKTLSSNAHRAIQSGTCVIELQVQGSIPQLCSWQRVRDNALRIAHECAILNEAGWTYIGKYRQISNHPLFARGYGPINSVADRLPQDSNPAATIEGPTLQLWMGPYQVPDNSQETLTCSSDEEPETSQHTSDISITISDSASTASSHLGSGRTLLNDTRTGCSLAGGTKEYNLTSADGP